MQTAAAPAPVRTLQDKTPAERKAIKARWRSDNPVNTPYTEAERAEIAELWVHYKPTIDATCRLLARKLGGDATDYEDGAHTDFLKCYDCWDGSRDFEKSVKLYVYYLRFDVARSVMRRNSRMPRVPMENVQPVQHDQPGFDIAEQGLDAPLRRALWLVLYCEEITNQAEQAGGGRRSLRKAVVDYLVREDGHTQDAAGALWGRLEATIGRRYRTPKAE
jgi:hypothetical protein